MVAPTQARIRLPVGLGYARIALVGTKPPRLVPLAEQLSCLLRLESLMKKIRQILLSAALVGLALQLVPIVHASSIPLTGKVRFFDTDYRGQSDGGGEFQANLYVDNFDDFDAGDPRQDILTFCIELDEFIKLSKSSTKFTEYTYQIDTKAYQGGVGGFSGSPPSDMISKGTAYLFELFHLGFNNAAKWLELGDYGATGGGTTREANAGLLQKAFWVLEDEVVSGDGKFGTSGYTEATNKYLQLVAKTENFGSLANAKMNYDPSTSNVRVLNPMKNGTYIQSQLVYVPDGGLTVLLLGSALGLFAVIRRRFGRA